MLFIAAQGARDIAVAQGVAANNLANLSTVGFRADLAHFESLALRGTGHASRASTVVAPMLLDLRQGPIEQTGIPTDVAIDGSGFLAVLGPDGKEAYTRRGDLRVGPEGLLVTGNGHTVLGAGGPVAVPPLAGISIARDGSVTATTSTDGGDLPLVVDRLRLVDPAAEDVEKLQSGLIGLKEGVAPPPEAALTLVPRAVEASNVSPIGELVKLIDMGRQFELQMRTVKAAEDADLATDAMLRSP